MENNQHLTYFKVENFKKFDSLEVKDIGQFNLIVGDNNVGKTCFLEALLFDERPKNTINWYHELLIKRRLVSSIFMLLNEANTEKNFEENTFSFYQKDKTKKINFILDKKEFSIENIIEEVYISNKAKFADFVKKHGLFDYDGIRKKSKNWILFENHNELRFMLDLTSKYYEDFINRPENSKIPIVPAIMLNDEIEKYLGKYYEEIFVKLDLGSKISKLINQIFPDIFISDFQPSNDISPVFFTSLFIKTKERDYFHNIREYGEGFVRALHILILILTSNSNKIMIDEIDTGIHHTKLVELWKTVIKLCYDLKTQLFATTHSKECAQAFTESVTKETKDGYKLIEIYQGNKGIKTYVTSEIENINYSINNLPFRGEKVNG